MKRFKAVLMAATLVLSMGVFTACTNDTEKAPEEKPAVEEKAEEGKEETAEEGKEENAEETAEVVAPEKDVEMKYITVDELKEKLDSDEYMILDLRKKADYEADHIEGAISADLDSIVSDNDFQKGAETVKEAIGDTDKNIVLVCYSGKRYAQAGTNVLSALGYDMEKVFTLEGGMKAWEK